MPARAVFTSFWDAQTADGGGMRDETIASSYLPLGSKVRVTINGKSEVGVIQDLGPAGFVYDRHRGKAVLDLNERMMHRLTGRSTNLVEGTWELISVGSGRTLYGQNLAGFPGGTVVPWAPESGKAGPISKPVWYSSRTNRKYAKGHFGYIRFDNSNQKNPDVSFCFQRKQFLGSAHIYYTGGGRVRARYVKDKIVGSRSVRTFEGPWTILTNWQNQIPLFDCCWDGERARLEIIALDNDVWVPYARVTTFQTRF